MKEHTFEGKWRLGQALDENKYVAAILMGLSKAFDCLPYDLHLLKIVSDYDQKIPQTADKPVATRGRATQQSRGTRKTS